MDPQEDLLDRDIPLSVLLPGGQETTAAVHGSKPVMDVLVTLCAQHHLVPSDHVIKLISTNQNHINFKPNSMIGSLEFERVVLLSKGRDANKKKLNIPVATVRLLINYKRSHKAVARVNPTVPLIELMPMVCEKCEFNPDATVLLKTYKSEETLDLTKTLNDYGIRELYAKEMKVVPTNPPVDPVSTHKGGVKEKSYRLKGNKGFFSLFKKTKKKPEQAVTESAPTSPELNGQCADRVNGLSGYSTLPMVSADMAKKRPAPKPPLTGSKSLACGLHTRNFSDLSESDPARKQGLLSRISSSESSLKRTKRRAPPPPGDWSTPSNSDNKDEAQGDDKRSDKHRARIADRCPAIAKVMSELAQSLQARQQRTLSSANCISQNQPAEDPSTGLFSERHTPEAELKALPGCQLLRSPSEREGSTTFTVVPRRCQQSRQYFDLPLTLQSSTATEAEKDLSPGDPDAIETPTTELLEELPSELFRNGGKGSDKSEHLSEVLHLQHLEKENQAWTDNESENSEQKYEEDLCIHESLESLQSGINNPEHLDSKMDNLELRDSKMDHLEDRKMDHLEDRKMDHLELGDRKMDQLELRDPKMDHLELRDRKMDNLELRDSKMDHLEDRKMDHLELRDSKMDHLELRDSKMDHLELRDSKMDHLELRDSKMDHLELRDRKMDNLERRYRKMDNLELRNRKMDNLELRDSKMNHLELRDSKMDHQEDRKMDHLELGDRKMDHLEDRKMDHLELGDRKMDHLELRDRKMDNLELRNRKMDHLELRDCKMDHLELRDSWVCPLKPANKLSDRSLINPNPGVVEREVEEHALVETEEEMDWVEQYKERRRKFLDGDNDGMIQREYTNLQEGNTMQEMAFPSPPPPVYWDEKSGEYKKDIENRSEQETQSCDDQWSNSDLSANSKPKYVSYQHYSKPKAHSTQTNPNAYTPGAENKCNFTPEPHKTLKSHSSFDPCPPSSVSMFALAVFQKAQRSKPQLLQKT